MLRDDGITVGVNPSGRSRLRVVYNRARLEARPPSAARIATDELQAMLQTGLLNDLLQAEPSEQGQTTRPFSRMIEHHGARLDKRFSSDFLVGLYQYQQHLKIDQAAPKTLRALYHDWRSRLAALHLATCPPNSIFRCDDLIEITYYSPNSSPAANRGLLNPVVSSWLFQLSAGH